MPGTRPGMGWSKLLHRCVGNRLRCNPEMFVEFLVRRAGAEAVHADEDTVGADEHVPTHAHRGLDADLDLRIADDGAADIVWLLQEQFEARHRDDAGGDALLGK